MASNKLLLITSIFLSLLSLSSSLSTSALLRAADALSNSGFLSMSLTLQLLCNNLTSSSSSCIPTPSLTIFAPSDSAFASSGQPSLSLLHFHFSPLRLPPSSLKSLPFHSKIPTLCPNRSLTVTTSWTDSCISLNGVRIKADSPIYDDGTSLIVFGIEEFLDPGYGVSGTSANHKCQAEEAEAVPFNDTTGDLEEAGEVLRSKGYSLMASFLELQVIGFKKSWITGTGLTLFAPIDQAMMRNSGNFSEYAPLFFRHLVPCKILWSDLIGFDDGGVELKTLFKGFKINVTRSGETLMLNGVEFSSLDLYYSDWLVVHGIRRALTVPQPPPPEKPEQVAAHDNGEF